MTDPGPSPEDLLAEIDALRTIVRRQHEYIGSMRASRFWKLRDAVFLFARRFLGCTDPLPEAGDETRSAEAVMTGDVYQRFRWRERWPPATLDLLAQFERAFRERPIIDVLIDTRGSTPSDIAQTIRSLEVQIYASYRYRYLDSPTSLEGDVSEYVTYVCAGDVLEQDALLHIVARFLAGADVVYVDEDQFDGSGVPSDPMLKPDWSPETQLTRDMTGRLCAIRGTLMLAAGGPDSTHGDAVWYDLALRTTERTNSIEHVTRVLLHRQHARAFDPDSGAAAAKRALARRGEFASVESSIGGWDVRFQISSGDRATILIPTRDHAELLERCLDSVFRLTRDMDFDVLVVDNGSVDVATSDLFRRWESRIRVISVREPFNYSRLINRGVAESDGRFVVQLNNDTEVISADWLARLVGQARRPEIGAVGALLLYPNGTVQHAGVVLGGVLSLSGHIYRYFEPEALNAPVALRLDTNYIAVTGACMAVERRKYQEVGGLDEVFAVAYNDVDLCLRLKERGYRSVLVPAARLIHYESVSRGADDTHAKGRRAQSEADLIRSRYPNWAARDPFYNPNLTLNSENALPR